VAAGVLTPDWVLLFFAARLSDLLAGVNKKKKQEERAKHQESWQGGEAG
jgi:hypothetical protein